MHCGQMRKKMKAKVPSASGKRAEMKAQSLRAIRPRSHPNRHTEMELRSGPYAPPSWRDGAAVPLISEPAGVTG